jgi:hypothetical protein
VVSRRRRSAYRRRIVRWGFVLAWTAFLVTYLLQLLILDVGSQLCVNGRPCNAPI